MFQGFVALIFLAAVVQLIIKDSFSNHTKYTLKTRFRRTLLASLILLIYGIYQSIDDAAINQTAFNPYFTLEVGRSASKKEIVAHTRKLARNFHPDRNTAPDATEQFNKVQLASKLLLNDDWRLAYDRFGDTFKAEHIETITSRPNLLLWLFVWDSLQHILTSFLLHCFFLQREIKIGKFSGIITYSVILGGLQTGILLLRFAPLRSDTKYICSTQDLQYFHCLHSRISIFENLPLVKNFTMFQRTKMLASLCPFLFTEFRLVETFWTKLLEEYWEMTNGNIWNPVDKIYQDLHNVLDSSIANTKQIILSIGVDELHNRRKIPLAEVTTRMVAECVVPVLAPPNSLNYFKALVRSSKSLWLSKKEWEKWIVEMSAAIKSTEAEELTEALLSVQEGDTRKRGLSIIKSSIIWLPFLVIYIWKTFANDVK